MNVHITATVQTPKTQKVLTHTVDPTKTSDPLFKAYQWQTDVLKVHGTANVIRITVDAK